MKGIPNAFSELQVTKGCDQVMQLHEEIRHLREQQGLTQGELAAGYATASYISIIEKGRAVPSRKVLRKIAERLGKPSYYFEAHISQSDETLELRTKVEQLKALASSGQMDEARALADELRTDIPSTTDSDLRGRYLMTMGYFFWAGDDLDAAISYYRQALEHYDTLQWHHRCIDALYGLGNINARRGNMRQAADYFKRAIAIDDTTGVGDPTTMYRLRIDYCNCLMRMGKTKEAHRLLGVLAASADNYQERILLMLNLSRASQEVGDYQQAFECASEASRLAQERGDLASCGTAQEIAAVTLIEMANYETAEKVLDDADLVYRRLGKTDDHLRVMILKARLAVCSGSPERAEELLGSLDVNANRMILAQAFQVQADKYQQQGNSNLAIEYLTSAAEAFMEEERFGQAIACWHQAAEISHADGNAPLAANLLFRAINAYNQSRKGVPCDETSS